MEYKRIKTKEQWDRWKEEKRKEQIMDTADDVNLQAARQLIENERLHGEKEQMELLRIKTRQEAQEMRDVLLKINPEEIEEIAHKINDAGMESILKDTLLKLREVKPEDYSERDRRYAITITEMEKVFAYFKTWVINMPVIVAKCDLCKEVFESSDNLLDSIELDEWVFHSKCYLIVTERLSRFMDIILLPEVEFNQWLDNDEE